MSELLTRDLIADKAIVHDYHPAIKRGEFDQTFGLPGGLYAASLGCFVAFLATMIVGFGNPELGIPMAIFGVFFAGFYGIPVLMVEEAPDESNKALTWGQFKARGIDTLTGRLPAGEAIAQMMVLPVLVVLWGFACITIAALV
ncbi:hypothetical protein [Parerythrobacter jejuensis]|uniref:Uncharacterized protein n=1 Tax=Parerythrobacter jejuensis TaxID=795812 RepID=A0A845ASB0_9SPHN|nr:hypothetical protein [Parerythrobacter jejuensis]MXP31845.1 hypothetical protein [Parerythrobacter jejuensis]